MSDYNYVGSSKKIVSGTTHTVQSSSDPRVPTFLSMNFSGQEAVPGLTEGKSLLKEQEAETPGLLPPSRHLHFLIPSYSIVANSGLANSPGLRALWVSMQIPSQGYVLVSALPLLSPGQTWTSSDRLVSDKLILFLAGKFILKLKWIKASQILYFVKV